MRISKRTREQAILICQTAASNDLPLTEAAVAIGLDGCRVAWDLVTAARDSSADAKWYRSARSTGGDLSDIDPYGQQCLEAEALLRDGWSPGDPVVRLGGAP